MLLGSEALNSLQVSRSEKEGNIQLAALGEEAGPLPGTLSWSQRVAGMHQMSLWGS